MFRTRRAIAFAALMLPVVSLPASAQWSTTYESMYLPGSFNWAFRRSYAIADRLFNGFDYGHAILYEVLYSTPDAPVSRLEEDRYDFITRELLPHPPRVPLEESAIEVAYAKIAPEAKAMFDWAHLLHRQIYDVWADERLSDGEKDAKIAELLAYYKSRPDLAFSSKPKTMELMEGQSYSLAFRQKYPKFNGLIWAYHWLQVGLYEPLIDAQNKSERVTGVSAAVSRFWQMIENPPSNMPRIMPMTAAVSPRFTERYPEAAIIFDNLHGMHDVISDILASDKVPRSQKRLEILRAAQRYRDDTSFVMTVAEWKDMAHMMGIENMGGPVRGLLAELPKPTVERGAAMVGMEHGKMDMTHSAPRAAKDSAAAHVHTAEMTKDSTAARMNMPGMARDSMAGHAGHAMGDTSARANSMPMMRSMMELHERMMRDSVIHQRIMADTAMRRLMGEMMGMMKPETTRMPDMEHEAHGETMRPTAKPTSAKKTQTSAATRSAKKPTATGAAATKKSPSRKPTTAKPKTQKPAEDHSRMKMPEMDHSKMKRPKRLRASMVTLGVLDGVG